MAATLNLADTVNEQVYTDYDTFGIVEICTPSILGAKACIGANVVSNYVALTISARTPFGSVSKTFKITKNINFTWQPFGLFKLEVSITNFAKTGGTISFKISVKVCVKVPFLGWKCISYSRVISIPASFHETNAALFSADENANLDQYATAYLLYAMADKEQSHCDCED
jgi:hypothetical protein